MQSTYERRVSEAREIERRLLSGTDDFRQSNFGAHARLVWKPPKTAAQIAALVGCTERNASRILSGEIAPPTILILKIAEHAAS